MGLFSNIFNKPKTEEQPTNVYKKNDTLTFTVDGKVYEVPKAVNPRDYKTYDGPFKVVTDAEIDELEKEAMNKRGSLLDNGKVTNEMFLKRVKSRLGIDPDFTPVDFTKLLELNELEKAALDSRPIVSRSGVNKDAFPEDTRLLFFDDIFHEIYSSVKGYNSHPEYIYSYISDKLETLEGKNFLIKLGGENQFLYFSTNSISHDATPFNVSFVDKNGTTLYKLIYEADGVTHGETSAVNNCLKQEVAFLELDEQITQKKIGRVTTEYLNDNLSTQERNAIKNKILVKLYKSKKYDTSQLAILREALEKNININYFSNPNFNSRCMKAMMHFVSEHPEQSYCFSDMEKVNLNFASQCRYQFTEFEWIYIFDSILHSNIDVLTTPEGKARLKLQFFKDQAASAQNNSYIFSINNRTFEVLANSAEYDNYELYELDENNKRTLMYSIKDDVEYGDEQEFIDIYIQKSKRKETRVLIENAIEEVKSAISNSSNENNDAMLPFLNGDMLHIEGVLLRDDDSFDDLIFSTEDPDDAVKEFKTGIRLYIENKTSKILVYSDIEEDNIKETYENAINKLCEHGEIETDLNSSYGSSVFETSQDYIFEDPLSPASKYYDAKEYMDTLKFKPETVIDRLMKKSLETQNKIFKQLNDRMFLKFVPVTISIDGNQHKECNLYSYDKLTHETKPLYVTTVEELDNESFLCVEGTLDDAVDFYTANEVLLEKPVNITNYVKNIDPEL